MYLLKMNYFQGNCKRIFLDIFFLDMNAFIVHRVSREGKKNNLYEKMKQEERMISDRLYLSVACL